MVLNGASSEYQRNTITPTAVNPGTNNITTGFEEGGYANIDGANANYEFYERIIYSGVHSLNEKKMILSYIQHRYAQDFGISHLPDYPFGERFDNNLKNSVVINPNVGFNQRSAFGEFEFNTTDDFILLKAKRTLYGFFPQYSHITVFENDVFLKTVDITVDQLQVVVPLSSGNKKITLVESLLSSPSMGHVNTIGTFLTSVKARNFSKVNESLHSDKIIFMGDSITVGGEASIPATQGYSRLFKIENGKNVAVLGYGYGTLQNFTGTTPLTTQTIGWITQLFANTTTSKKLVIAMGTNDWGLTGILSAGWETLYGQFLDAVHLADNSIKIYCISPLNRTGEDQRLIDFRTGISNAVNTRTSFCTYINGNGILSVPTDFTVGGVHPTTAGHKKYKDSIYPIIYP